MKKLNEDNAIHIGFNKEVGVMNMAGIIGSGMIVTINVLISLVIGGCLAIKLIENRILEVKIWAVPWWGLPFL